MPAVLTHKAIMLLARERLAEIRDVLTAKKATAGEQLTDLELRVLYLAGKAHDLMSRVAPIGPEITLPAVGNGGARLGENASRFAVMGSMGPDITGFSGLLAYPQGKWVFDLVHKGTPDENREPVVARSTDFVLQMWREASTRIDARPADDDAQRAKKAEARDAVRAYLLGHLCHLAGDAVAHPFIHDVEWHLGTASQDKLSHGRGEMSIDARVAQRVLRRGSAREGQAWDLWWPAPGTVPAELFEAYDAALEEVYRARTDRPKGFGGFEKELRDVGALALNPAFVREGYGMMRGGAVGMVYGWGYGSWWLFLAPLALSLMAAGPLAAALPRGSKLTTEAAWRVEDERAWFEYLTLPMAATALVPVFYGTWLAGMTTLGVEGITIFGQIDAWVNLVLAVTFFATLGVADLPWELRWLLLFGLPMAMGIVLGIIALAERKHRKGAAVLALVYGFPAVFALVYQGLALPLGSAIAGIIAEAGDPGDAGTGQAVGHWVATGLVIVAAGLIWFWGAYKLREAKLPERPEPFPAERRHFVRLFDDTTLFHHLPPPPAAGAPAPPPPNPTLAERYFPAEARELLVLWWEGDGELYVRSRRTHLEFSFTAAGAAPQRVPGPVTPMTPREYGDLLTATVRDAGGATGKLKAALVHERDAELDAELPPGATFASAGDLLEDARKQGEAAARWTRVKAAREDGFVLRHAPKAVQAVRFSRGGPVPFSPLQDEEVPGPGTVRSERIHVHGTDTDFAALFAPGDRIVVGGQVRTVTLVPAADRLVISSPLDPDAEAGSRYARLGTADESREGYEFVADPTVRGGQTVMDYAADFAALLCLGATPHLLDRAELTVPDLEGKLGPGDGPVSASVAPPYQVFRNWSLDRRRVNEWRMLVAGGALSEKGGDPLLYDAAMTTPAPAAWTPDVNYEERTLLAHGWVPLLRSWLARPAQPGQHAANPVPPNAAPGVAEQTSNRDLSRALAYLLDMPDPVAIH